MSLRVYTLICIILRAIARVGYIPSNYAHYHYIVIDQSSDWVCGWSVDSQCPWQVGCSELLLSGALSSLNRYCNQRGHR